jgi:hypothetical protein
MHQTCPGAPKNTNYENIGFRLNNDFALAKSWLAGMTEGEWIPAKSTLE